MPKMKKFVGLETDFEVDNKNPFDNYTIDNGYSLLDYESVVVNANNLIDRYLENSTTSNMKILLSMENSVKIQSDFHRIESQLKDLLKMGQNVYVFVGDNAGCLVWSSSEYKKEKNNFSPYSFLPLNYFSTSCLVGSSFEVVDNRFRSFFENNRLNVSYKKELYYRGLQPILKVPGTNRIVSGYVEYEKGMIIFLPYFDFLSNYDRDSILQKNAFAKSLIELDSQLSSPQDEPTYPDWIENYNVMSESADIAQLLALENEKIMLQQRIDSQKERLGLLKKYKGIFTSTGEQLESIVKEIFSKMDFSILPTEKGRTDVIAKINEVDVVMEIKGLTKSAAEKNAAQLEKWVSMFIEKNERTPKPLLIVNAFCNLMLEERTENSFPNQMLSYSVSRNHCLLTTTQLLCLFIEISEKPECKEERIRELLNTVGIYTRYSDYTNYIKKVK